MPAYFKNIAEGISSTLKGMSLTLRHIVDARRRRKPGDIRAADFFRQGTGMVTIQYPQEVIPIPDHGRYRLHNEMDDCIVCDKCAKVCPVDCIDIEPVKAIEEVGRTSDGSPIRLYAAKFDIDMAKCCYCGLCTTVCPTECLTMTKTFDYSEIDVVDMVYHYANLSPEKATEKKELLAQFQKEKELQKAEATREGSADTGVSKPAGRPVFKPSLRPQGDSEEEKEVTKTEPAKKVFRPGMKPGSIDRQSGEIKQEQSNMNSATPRPVFKSVKGNTSSPAKSVDEVTSVRSSFRPGPALTGKLFSGEPLPSFIVPKKKASQAGGEPTKKVNARVESKPEAPARSGGGFRPTMKPGGAGSSPAPVESKPETPARSGGGFRPTMKPGGAGSSPAPVESKPEVPVKPGGGFRPTIKPKTDKPALTVEEGGSVAAGKTDGRFHPGENLKTAFFHAADSKGFVATGKNTKSSVSADVPEVRKSRFRPYIPERGDDAALTKSIQSLPGFTLSFDKTDLRGKAGRDDAGKATEAEGTPRTAEEKPNDKPAMPRPGFRPTMKPKS